MPYHVLDASSGALALTISWMRSARVRSGSGISAIFSSRSLSPSALPFFSRFSSAARSFIAAFSSPVKPPDSFATFFALIEFSLLCMLLELDQHLPWEGGYKNTRTFILGCQGLFCAARPLWGCRLAVQRFDV